MASDQNQDSGRTPQKPAAKNKSAAPQKPAAKNKSAAPQKSAALKRKPAAPQKAADPKKKPAASKKPAVPQKKTAPKKSVVEPKTAAESIRTIVRERRKDPNTDMMRRQFEVQKKIRIGIGCAAAALVVGMGAAALLKSGAVGSIGTSVPNGAEAQDDVMSAAVEAESQAAFSDVSEPVQEGPQVAIQYDDGREVMFQQDPSYTEHISILSTGDNIIHEALYKGAKTDDGYDFSSMYAKVKPLIQAADLATVNQEGPLATDLYPVEGYPYFNSPTQTADALVDTGFDILNLANNHVLDKGPQGIQATIKYLDSKGIPYVGAYKDHDDMYEMRVIEENGIKVAFLGFLTFTNADLDLNEGNNSGTMTQAQLDDVYWESLAGFKYSEDRIKKLVETADEAADIVVVHCHWGEENKSTVTDDMKEMANKLVDWGADFIVGNHSHVLQQMRVIQRESDGKLVPVQYGGGNFLSGQKERDHLISVLTTADFAKNPDTGDVICTGLHAVPLVTHYEGDRQNVVIYPLKDYTEDLAASHGVRTFDDPMTLDYLWDCVNEQIPSRFIN